MKRLGPYGLCPICNLPNGKQAVQFHTSERVFVHQGACTETMRQVLEAAWQRWLKRRARVSQPPVQGVLFDGGD